MNETPYMAQRRKMMELRDKQEAATPLTKKKTKKKLSKKAASD